MKRIEKILNFNALGKLAGVNSGSLRAVWLQMKKGKINYSNSSLLQKTEEALNNELCLYLNESRYEKLRLCAMGRLVTNLEGGEHLEYDAQCNKIYLTSPKGRAVVEKGSPKVDIVYKNLFLD